MAVRTATARSWAGHARTAWRCCRTAECFSLRPRVDQRVRKELRELSRASIPQATTALRRNRGGHAPHDLDRRDLARRFRSLGVRRVPRGRRMDCRRYLSLRRLPIATEHTAEALPEILKCRRNRCVKAAFQSHPA